MHLLWMPADTQALHFTDTYKNNVKIYVYNYPCFMAHYTHTHLMCLSVLFNNFLFIKYLHLTAHSLKK